MILKKLSTHEEVKGAKLLRALALYGENAAGKTNFLSALVYLKFLITDSSTQLKEGEPTRVQPFRLDEESEHRPTEFKLRCVIEGVRYDFELHISRSRILYESLSAYPKGREQVWYVRQWDEEKNKYSWSPKKATDYRRDPNLVKYTRDNALYLSTASNFNDEQLKPIYLWFKTKIQPLRILSDGSSSTDSRTARQLVEANEKSGRIVKMLRQADLGILSARASVKRWERKDIGETLPDEIVERLSRLGATAVELVAHGSGIADPSSFAKICRVPCDSEL